MLCCRFCRLKLDVFCCCCQVPRSGRRWQSGSQSGQRRRQLWWGGRWWWPVQLNPDKQQNSKWHKCRTVNIVNTVSSTNCQYACCEWWSTGVNYSHCVMTVRRLYMQTGPALRRLVLSQYSHLHLWCSFVDKALFSVDSQQVSCNVRKAIWVAKWVVATYCVDVTDFSSLFSLLLSDIHWMTFLICILIRWKEHYITL